MRQRYRGGYTLPLRSCDIAVTAGRGDPSGIGRWGVAPSRRVLFPSASVTALRVTDLQRARTPVQVSLSLPDLPGNHLELFTPSDLSDKIAHGGLHPSWGALSIGIGHSRSGDRSTAPPRPRHGVSKKPLLIGKFLIPILGDTNTGIRQL